jgi:endonuclease/exonuclease/phosphatase family metal-dependent hydrolase
MKALTFSFLITVLVGCTDAETGPDPAAGGMTASAGMAGSETGAAGSAVAGSSSGGSGTSAGGSAGSGGMPAASGSAGQSGGGGGAAGGPSEPVSPTVKVMTFNIRYGTAPDGDNAWSIRKPLAFDVFTRQKADLVGVQEALDAQLVDIDVAVAGYARVGVGRDDGMKKGEYSAIYYRSERFEVESSGTFWFSDTPEVPGSKSWGNDIPRICTWAHLIEKQTGYGLYHFNLHLDHMSQPSREKSVVLLMQRASDRMVASDPLIVTGDFNAGEENLATLYMQGKGMVGGATNPLPLVDSFRAMFPDEDEVKTAHGFSGGSTGGKIDYVYMDAGQMALAAEIDRTNVDGRYPSDHYPVSGTLQLPARP